MVTLSRQIGAHGEEPETGDGPAICGRVVLGVEATVESDRCHGLGPDHRGFGVEWKRSQWLHQAERCDPDSAERLTRVHLGQRGLVES